MQEERVVIVGSGAAGLAAAERLKDLGTRLPVLIVTGEDGPPYSRLRLPEYAAGLISEQEIVNRPVDYFQQLGIQIKTGKKVTSIDPNRQIVKLEDGEEINYSRLLVATGSIPRELSVPGNNLTGVFKLWSRKDAEAIRTYLPQTKVATVVGAGLIGLKLAEVLSKAGIKVRVIEREAKVLPGLLDERAAVVVANYLTRADIELYLGEEIKAIAGKTVVEGVVLEDERFLPCQMVIIAIGVRPNIDFVIGTGVKVNKGIEVDDHMATSIPGIWAAGDVVESKDIIRGTRGVNAIWYNAVQQGRIAAENIVGIPSVFPGSIAMNSFKLFDLNLVALGYSAGEQAVDGEGCWESITISGSFGYRKEVFAKDSQRMIGFLALGDISLAGYAYYRILRDNLCDDF